MADNLTDVAENLTLDFLHGNSPTVPVLPLKLRLFTVAGTDSAAGTEVTGGSYAPQNVALAAAAAGATSNDAAVEFLDMPAISGATQVVAWDIVDASGSPRRLWHGPFTTPKNTNAGDTFTVPAGDLDLSIS